MPTGTTWRWTDGAADGNWNTVSNWEDDGAAVGTFVASSLIPPTAKDIVFNKGSTNITALATGIAPSSLTINGTRYNFGSAGSSITFTGITGVLLYAGQGANAYFGVTAGNTLTKLHCEHSGGLFALASGTLGTGGSAAAPDHYNSGGELQIAAAVVMTSAFLENGTGKLTVLGNNNAGGTITNSGGGPVTITDRTGLTLGCTAGTTTAGGASALTSATVQPGALLLDQCSGTTTAVNVMPRGIYSLAGISYTSKTVTAINYRPGANLTYTGIPGCSVTATLVPIGAGAIGIGR